MVAAIQQYGNGRMNRGYRAAANSDNTKHGVSLVQKSGIKASDRQNTSWTDVEDSSCSEAEHDLPCCNACSDCNDCCSNSDCTECRRKQARLDLNAIVTCKGNKPTYTMCQVRRHNHAKSAWLVAGDRIYDATPFLASHPGGDRSILKKAGGVSDCSRDMQFHSKTGMKQWKRAEIGRLVPCCCSQSVPESKQWWMFW